MDILDRSALIAEDITSDFFAFSSSHWARHPYEIKTLKESESVEFPHRTYAHLLRYDSMVSAKMSGRDSYELYHICLHDHNILEETGGSHDRLLPFMVYVLSHELVHIARFSRHHCNLLSSEKAREEEIVHAITHSMLDSVPITGLDRVLQRFSHHCGTS
jgi:hypothetical protein